ncbi:MAG: AgmX/PglI C-terminal domain-containing protein [Myxococcaceae bacterium]|nr:AgmX/PglI C-terminal domain-containing protein [Myxococcaceae bacterium]
MRRRGRARRNRHRRRSGQTGPRRSGFSFIAETSLQDAEVEQCILSRINRWRFPEPRGGGVVAVNYPWIFRPAGAD